MSRRLGTRGSALLSVCVVGEITDVAAHNIFFWSVCGHNNRGVHECVCVCVCMNSGTGLHVVGKVVGSGCVRGWK